MDRRCFLLPLLALLVGGCSSSPLTPTAPVPAAPALREMDYAINIPIRADANALLATYPNGVHLAPVAAQQQWNYTAIYGGSPNVYFGETAPLCQYPGVGIVVAPLHVASLDQFTAGDWPGVLEAGVTYVWVGRFVYTAAGVPGWFSLDPAKALACASTPKT